MDNSSSSRNTTGSSSKPRLSLGSLRRATVSLGIRLRRKSLLQTRLSNHNHPSHEQAESRSPRASSHEVSRRIAREEQEEEEQEPSSGMVPMMDVSSSTSTPVGCVGPRRCTSQHHRFPGTRKAQEDAFLDFLDQNDHSIFLQLQQQNLNDEH